MAKIIPLLTSEDFVKRISPISDNLSSKYLLSALREAQEVHLKSILGSALLDNCKALVGTKELNAPENAHYAELIEHCRYYLAYWAIAECTMTTSYKVANMGVVRTTDDNVQAPTFSEIALIKKQYENKADFYCKELQLWLKENHSLFPELSECECQRISANIHYSASCGVFLGGARGKI